MPRAEVTAPPVQLNHGLDPRALQPHPAPGPQPDGSAAAGEPATEPAGSHQPPVTPPSKGEAQPQTDDPTPKQPGPEASDAQGTEESSGPEAPPAETNGQSPATASEPSATPVGDATDPADHAEPVDQSGDAWPARPSEPRVIALLNQKGGVGKTTTATNLAAALTQAGYNVLAIDLDPQAHLTLSLGIDPDELEKTIYQLLVDGETSADEVVQKAEDERTGTLHVIPSEVNLAGVESELAQKTIIGAAQTTLRDKTRELARQFDYVLLDCPPSLGILTINALATAREVIVPMQAHFLALQGLSKLLETVQMVRSAINPSLFISGIVLCMHERQTVLANEVVNDLNQFLEEARGTESPWNHAIVYHPPVRRNIKLAECPSFGQSVFSYAPESNGAADYRQLAAHVAQHQVTV